MSKIALLYFKYKMLSTLPQFLVVDFADRTVRGARLEIMRLRRILDRVFESREDPFEALDT